MLLYSFGFVLSLLSYSPSPPPPPRPHANMNAVPLLDRLHVLLNRFLPSSVFCAVKKTGEECAVKKITKSQLQSYDHDALKDEVKLLSECKHPNIIRYIDFFDEPEYYYLLSEVVSKK